MNIEMLLKMAGIDPAELRKFASQMGEFLEQTKTTLARIEEKVDTLSRRLDAQSEINPNKDEN